MAKWICIVCDPQRCIFETNEDTDVAPEGCPLSPDNMSEWEQSTY